MLHVHGFLGYVVACVQALLHVGACLVGSTTCALSPRTLWQRRNSAATAVKKKDCSFRHLKFGLCVGSFLEAWEHGWQLELVMLIPTVLLSSKFVGF